MKFRKELELRVTEHKLLQSKGFFINNYVSQQLHIDRMLSITKSECMKLRHKSPGAGYSTYSEHARPKGGQHTGLSRISTLD